MIHAKTLTIDGVWSSVGSVNFDNRSFQLQDEVTLCVCSHEFARQLDEQFERDLERSERINLERWSERPLPARVSEAVTKVARREL
jgi:cardiolipin synthase